jgi:uncharacterized protein (TIGR00290 family)
MHASRPKALMSWSSGKDSAFALHELLRANEVEVVGLLTVVNSTYERVAMHAVRRALLEAQARALGLPLWTVELPWPSSNEIYEQAMSSAVRRAREAGVEAIAFGDLFLEDIRAYRERQLAGTGLAPIFPLWGRATDALARTMIDEGVRAVVTCVDPKLAPAALAGRAFDAALLEELPAGCDPCGERGEFHTFVFDGPRFAAPLDVEVTDVVERDGFVFADVVPT